MDVSWHRREMAGEKGLLLGVGEGTGKIKMRKSHGLDDNGHKSVSQSVSQRVSRSVLYIITAVI
jgi:hypothetical protein